MVKLGLRLDFKIKPVYSSEPGFKVWGTKYIFRGKIFVFIKCLKHIFLGATKFGVTQNFWGTAPNATHSYGPASTQISPLKATQRKN